MEGVIELVKDNQLCVSIHHIIRWIHFYLFHAWWKHLEERNPSDLSSSLNIRCCKLWFESFGNVFYNAPVLIHKKRKCISSLQRYHDQNFPFNNCKDVKALLSALNDEFRKFFFIDVHETLWPAFQCIESDSLSKSAIKKSPFLSWVYILSIFLQLSNHL